MAKKTTKKTVVATTTEKTVETKVSECACSFVDEDKWLGKVLTDEDSSFDKAMEYAAVNDRPLIVDYSYNGCGSCDEFHKNVTSTAAWKNFIKKNGIVMYKTNTLGEANTLFRKWSSKDYKIGSAYPWLVMYGVSAKNSKTTPYEAKTPRTSKGSIWTNQGIGTGGGNTLFGVKLPMTKSMKSADIEALVQAWFPNTRWDSIECKGSCSVLPNGNCEDGSCSVVPNNNCEDGSCSVVPNDNCEDGSCSVLPDSGCDDGSCSVLPDCDGGECSVLIDGDKWLGKVLTAKNSSSEDALKYAAENDRPLLVDFGYVGCGHCDVFDKNVIDTKEWSKFLSDEKMVMYKTTMQSEMTALLKSWNGRDFQPNGAYPYLIMFHVKKSTKKSAKSAYEVKTCQTVPSKQWTGITIPPSGGTFFGVKLPALTKQKPSDWSKLVKAWFPNSFWK